MFLLFFYLLGVELSLNVKPKQGGGGEFVPLEYILPYIKCDLRNVK